MSQNSDTYGGTDNLEVMEEAVNYNRFLVDTLRAFLRPEDVVVDFGAGIGTFARAIRADVAEVLAVELDDRQRRTMAEAGLATEAAIETVPGASATAVYTFNVLEHIDDDVGALRELHRVLRPGGRLLVYVPAFMALYTAMDRKVGHVRRYTRGELVSKLETAGFVVRSARYVDSVGFLATLVYRFVGDSSGGIDRDALRLYDRVAFPISRMLDRVAFSRIGGKNVLVEAVRR